MSVQEVSYPVPLPSAGVHREKNERELDPTELRDSQNWILRDGRMRTRDGVGTIASNLNQRPNGFIGYTDADGTQVLVMGTDTSAYVFDDATQDWVDLAAGFSGESLHSIFRVFEAGTVSTTYIQNGIDDPQKWALGDATTADAGAMPVGTCMMLLADHMIVGNVSAGTTGYAGETGPTVVAVSVSQDPDTGYDGTGGSLVAQLLDTPGAIVGMLEAGALQGYIYKTDAIYAAVASDTAVPFTFEPRKVGVSGPVSPRAIVSDSRGVHYYLARDGNVMVFDGNVPVDMGRHVQRFVLDYWDVDLAHKAHATYDDENNEIHFFFCGVGSPEPNRKLVIKLTDNTIWPMKWATLRWTAAIKAQLPGGTTIGDLGPSSLDLTVGELLLTLGEYSNLGLSYLMGEEGGQSYVEDGSLDDASPFEAYFDTGASGLGEPLRFKSVRFIDHEFATAAATQNVQITVKKSNYGEDMVSDSARTVDVSAGGPYRTYHRFPGRRYALRMYATVSSAIEWLGSTAVYALQGRR